MGSALPQDRESLFWFNVLEIRQNQKAKKKARFKIASTRLFAHGSEYFSADGLKGTHGDAAYKPEVVAERRLIRFHYLPQNDARTTFLFPT